MTTAALERLADPEFRKWLVENISEEDRNKYGAFLKRELEAAKYNWQLHARPEQLPPDGDWFVWLTLAGRGYGKSRQGAEWVKAKLREFPGCRIAILAPTTADTRDTCVEGDSGLINVLPPEEVKAWNRSLGELVHVNGSRVKCFSGDEPERLRGPQHHFAWVDELAAFRYPEAWDQLMFGLRLGEHPQVVVTTTPKPTKLIRELIERDRVHVTRGSTFDNAANLAPAALEELKAKYGGTRLGRQELYAEILTDVPGALATLELLDAHRVSQAPELVRITVSVDPAVTNTIDSDETGIQVMGKGIDGHCYHLADRSCRTSVDDWTRRAVKTAVEFNAGKIKYEKNQGHDAIGLLIQRAMDDMGVRGIVIEDVNASKSKFDRALGLQQSIERGVYHLVGSFPELEEQYTTWTINDGTSPDRLDSAVHGHNDLMEEDTKPKLRFYG